jgi:hypothetical protein
VVDGSFEDLDVGQKYAWSSLTAREHGAQASTVKPVSKHHLIE